MLKETHLVALDTRLLTFHGLLTSTANHTAVIAGVSAVLGEVVHDPQNPKRADVRTQALLYPGWEQTWRDLGCVVTGGFGGFGGFGDVARDETNRALHLAFTELVRLALDSCGPRRQRKHRDQARDAVTDYLEHRGHHLTVDAPREGPLGPTSFAIAELVFLKITPKELELLTAVWNHGALGEVPQRRVGKLLYGANARDCHARLERHRTSLNTKLAKKSHGRVKVSLRTDRKTEEKFYCLVTPRIEGGCDGQKSTKP